MFAENVTNPLGQKMHLMYTSAFTLEIGVLSVKNVENLSFNVPPLLVTAEFILEKSLMNPMSMGKH
jgi:hypothetical protein